MKEKFTVADFKKLKLQGKKITMLTAYDYPTAKIFDEAGIDAILVGDSLGMVVMGYEDTVKVTMADMIHHTKIVARGTKNAMVIADMPFMSYHTRQCDSVRNAGRLISEGGCNAVKIEGGRETIRDILAIIAAGIPVMGHLGYTPQSVNLFGKDIVRGKLFEDAQKIYEDAIMLQEAGVFAITLECVPYKLAELISKKLSVPTIGIGSGIGCDGQVLVSSDATGLYRDFVPKHSKRFANIGDDLEKAVKSYIIEVREKIFPTKENSFNIDDDIIKRIKNMK